MITEISHEAVAMAQRMKDAVISGDVALQLHWADELAFDAILRGATRNEGEEGINGTITESVRT